MQKLNMSFYQLSTINTENLSKDRIQYFYRNILLGAFEGFICVGTQ